MDDQTRVRGTPRQRVSGANTSEIVQAGLIGWIVGNLAASLTTTYAYVMPIVIAIGIFFWPSKVNLYVQYSHLQ